LSTAAGATHGNQETMSELLYTATALPVAPSLLGESPFWHPDEAALYWCDIPGKRLNRFRPAGAVHHHWDFPCEPASMAPLLGGDLLLAMRDGLWRFDPRSGQRLLLAPPPYDPAHERFNDGKADAQGRFWVGTIYEPRDPPKAALYCWSGGDLTRRAANATVSNGLGWSPDGRTLYWSDTKAHVVYAFDADPTNGAISRQRVFAQFPLKQAGHDLSKYGGRPDGAAVDREGAYWSAQFEGQRLLRLAPSGEVLREVRLPVRCATMPCFGDDDLKTLYVTTARENRPADELAAQPLAGCVLRLRVEVAGLPVNFAAG
jgi:sugar lactone lactonase YvrE